MVLGGHCFSGTIKGHFLCVHLKKVDLWGCGRQ